MGLRARNSLSFGAAALAISVMAGSLAMAESAPLERDILIFPGMSSSATLPAGGFLAATGQQQGNLSGSGGTGNQLYHHQLEYGLTDSVQIGATVQRNENLHPVMLALWLDRFTGGRLETVCALHGVERPEELAQKEELILPPEHCVIRGVEERISRTRLILLGH